MGRVGQKLVLATRVVAIDRLNQADDPHIVEIFDVNRGRQMDGHTIDNPLDVGKIFHHQLLPGFRVFIFNMMGLTV